MNRCPNFSVAWKHLHLFFFLLGGRNERVSLSFLQTQFSMTKERDIKGLIETDKMPHQVALIKQYLDGP